MNINVGTKNESKSGTVENVLKEYVVFQSATVTSVNAASGVPRMPIGLVQVTRGARNRAKEAYESGKKYGQGGRTYGFGLEHGLVPFGPTYGLQCVASFYDGTNYYDGRSNIRRLPAEVIDLVVEGDGEVSINDAYKKLSTSPSFSKIKMMTKKTGRRKQFRQAVRDALSQYLTSR